jgi:hypothetical protein
VGRRRFRLCARGAVARRIRRAQQPGEPQIVRGVREGAEGDAPKMMESRPKLTATRILALQALTLYVRAATRAPPKGSDSNVNS